MAKNPLPQNCAGCVYFRSGKKSCHRHAPGTASEEYQFTEWPLVRPTDRCGEGAEVGDGTGEQAASCGMCVHWWRPDDKPPAPAYGQGKPAEWWKDSGICTRFAPGPSGSEDREVFWRVTHITDSCGDGEEILPEIQEDFAEPKNEPEIYNVT